MPKNRRRRPASFRSRKAPLDPIVRAQHRYTHQNELSGLDRARARELAIYEVEDKLSDVARKRAWINEIRDGGRRQAERTFAEGVLVYPATSTRDFWLNYFGSAEGSRYWKLECEAGEEHLRKLIKRHATERCEPSVCPHPSHKR